MLHGSPEYTSSVQKVSSHVIWKIETFIEEDTRIIDIGQWCLRNARASALLWWSCQSPGAHSCSLLNYLNTFHRELFKLNSKLDADSILLYSLSHFECDVHTVHMLIQQCLLPPLTSTLKSSLFTYIPIHSPWLPDYIDVTQTILIILTMAGLFSRQTSYLLKNFKI